MTLDTDIEWRPTAGLAALQLRAEILRRLRAFFDVRGVMEVETPALSKAATTDPHLHSFATQYHGAGDPCVLYLHTSPEFPMKRLLVAGCGSIYQICKVFRDNESGSQHNPEFTMLEWYRIGFDYHRLMDEVAALVTEALMDRYTFEAVSECLTYREAFQRYAAIDGLTDDAEAWRRCAGQHDVTPPAGLAVHVVDEWRDFIFSHVVQHQLGRGRLTFVYDYPATQASLACLRQESPPVAERFELFLNGIELANGFHELRDAGELRRRIEGELKHRQTCGLPSVPGDQALLAACEQGLPPCAGVALGVDRLLMLAADTLTIDEVIAFPVERA